MSEASNSNTFSRDEALKRLHQTPRIPKNRNSQSVNTGYIACPQCKKTGVDLTKKGDAKECPLCSRETLRQYGIPHLNIPGWTTRDVVNAQYIKIVGDLANQLVNRLLEKETFISNRAKKQFIIKKTREITNKFLSEGKYKLLEEESRDRFLDNEEEKQQPQQSQMIDYTDLPDEIEDVESGQVVECA